MRALAALPVLQLSERLGPKGFFCTNGLEGILPFADSAEPETCFTEEMALEYAVTELEPLSFLLHRLLDQVCAVWKRAHLPLPRFACDLV